MVRRLAVPLLVAALLAGSAMAQEARPAAPIRQIAVYVTPYYNNDGRGGVQVAVDRAFDRLLAAPDRASILRVRDAVAASPARHDPVTLMVLASRLYDVGERDEAVFWFYAGRYRFLTLVSVLDDGRRGDRNTATRALVELVGPAINGYAFCNLETQAAAEERALAWVTANPHEALQNSRFKARPGDRAANLAGALARIRRIIDEQNAGLATPDGRAALLKGRAEAQADARFCW